MFGDPDTTEIMCKVLAAYIEEWGPEHVTIKLPASWGQRCTELFTNVECVLASQDTVTIHAGTNALAHYSFSVPVPADHLHRQIF